MNQPIDNDDPRVLHQDGTVAYNSIDEMLAAMKEAEENAVEQSTPTQRAIDYGSFVLKPIPEMGILCFARIFTKEERDKEETSYTISRLDDAFRRGYRTGMWFSDVVPEGEQGDGHVATLWPISEEEFRAAESTGFSTPRIATSAWGIEMLRRVHHEAGAEMGATVDEAGAGFTVVEDDGS